MQHLHVVPMTKHWRCLPWPALTFAVHCYLALPACAGEAYDKVARLLGLDLNPSGGAALEAFAQEGDPTALPFSVPMQRRPTCDFSYAGLKTAVRLAIEERAPEATGGWAGGRVGGWDGLQGCGRGSRAAATAWAHVCSAECARLPHLRGSSCIVCGCALLPCRGQPAGEGRHRRQLPAGGGAAPGGAVPAGGAVGPGVAPRGG